MINDEELPLLYDLNMSNHLDLPYDSYPVFDFDDLEDDECLSEFPFHKNDLPFLDVVLGTPEVAECYQRGISSGLEVLCILLKRYSYPHCCATRAISATSENTPDRYSDLKACFGKPIPVLCMINNSMIDYTYQAHIHRILQWHDRIFNLRSQDIYSNATTAKGSPLDNCFGFIGETV